ncbi:L-lactate dehydrogenase [Neisseria perflava]|uniref:L-lactate dehydrogenase n=1 Tax=Neisseria perflava TaxID=33053 RepID=UPI00209E4668|nr:L-lactate dehydrogenase [Neisseria perflava]MCP1660773.1 L-lactate dehydrogenase [Neisseria perflava]MCP1771456.1 L-lactate dehydrogenase [Neisseria perflava]
MSRKVGNKVVLIGVGAVGISYAYSMLNQGHCDELVLIDLNRKRAEGEARDLRHGMPYAPTPAQIYVGDYTDCADADIVCICAGVPQRSGETRLDLIDNNLRVFHSIVTAVMNSGFDGIFLVATNPVDVLSYATWRFSGLPKERVIGSGTILDSARFCVCLGNEFDVASWSVDAMMMGEHGDSVIAVWSSATIAGVPLKEILEQNEQGKARMEKIYNTVRNAAYEIIEAKGSTSYGIGMALSRISKAILHNQSVVLPVSALLNGEFGQENVYIGVPAVINRQGAVRVINKRLDEEEAAQFEASAKLLKSYQQKVDDFLGALD